MSMTPEQQRMWDVLQTDMSPKLKWLLKQIRENPSNQTPEQVQESLRQIRQQAK